MGGGKRRRRRRRRKKREREMHTLWCKGDVELITLWNDIIPSSSGLPPTHQQKNTKSIPLVLRGKKMIN